MSYQVIRNFPKQNAFTIVKEYKSRSGAQEFLKKNPNLSLRKVK